MRNRTTWILLAIAVVLTSYIVLFERGRMGPNVPKGRIFPYMGVDDFVAVTIERAGETIALERRGADWHIIAPIAFPAESPRVSGLLLAIMEFEVKARVPSDTKGFFAETGPEAVLTVRFESGEEKRIEVGAAHPSVDIHDRYYRIGDTTFIGDGALAGELVVGVTALRDRTISGVTRQRAERVEVAAADGTALRFTRRRPGHWKAEAPFQGRAAAASVGELVEAFNRLAAESFIDDAAGRLAEFGLDAPRYRVAIREQGAEAATTILVGAERKEDADGRGLLYLTWEGRDTVCIVRDLVTTLLGEGEAFWRDAALLDMGVDPVARCALSWPGGGLTLGRTEDEGWDLRDAAGEELPTTEMLVENLIDDLRALRIRSPTPPAGEANYEEPALRIEVELAGSGEVIRVRLARIESVADSVTFAARIEDAKGEVREGPYTSLTELPNQLRTWGAGYCRDRVVARVAAQKIWEVEIRRGPDLWRLGFPSDRWVLQGREGVSDLIDQKKVLDLIAYLAAPRAQFFAASPPSPARVGLDPPQIRVKIGTVAGFAPEYTVLSVGERKDVNDPLVWVRLGDSGTPFQATTTELDALIDHLKDIGG